MGLATAIRQQLEAVRVATAGPDGLQVNVVHEPWIGQDGRVKPIFDTAVTRPALVQFRRPQQLRSEGQQIAARVILSFFGPVAPNGAIGRREPFDPRDKITLPDGTTGPIVDVQSMPAPDTNEPLLTVVYLG